MITTKMVSMRLSSNLLGKLEDFCAQHTEFSRTSVVENVLTNVFECSDEQTLWDIVSTFDGYSSSYNVRFEKKNKL